MPLALSVSLLLAGLAAAPRATPSPRSGPAAGARRAASPTPTARPTPVPPPRERAVRKGGPPTQRVARFANRHVTFTRLQRVEEIDLDRDGTFESIVEGIGTVRSIPPGAPTLGLVSASRLPFESQLLTVLDPRGNDWAVLFLGHLPLRCGQADDLARCDQLVAYRSVRFRFDDRPQVLVQILHAGEGGLHETHTYRSNGAVLAPTFSITLPRESVDVSVDPTGIRRRLAVDTFVNRELPLRYRSFTLNSSFIFGERRFRVHSETVEEEWSEKGDVELTYWGLVHQPSFAGDLERLRERSRKGGTEAASSADPAEIVRRRYGDATEVRVAARQTGLALVYFRRPGCLARAVVYQPLREWEGDRSPWEMAVIRGRRETPYECLDEPPLGGGPP
ncbi:MAG: hypothetical protein ABR576_12895 [Thermoanaerobaculia bacterium]